MSTAISAAQWSRCFGRLRQFTHFPPMERGSKEKIYQVSAYTPRYHSWVGGTWTPWNTGMPWEEGKIAIFNARVTIPEKGLSTHASQYFIFTYGAFRKPLCKNIPSG